ncbi:MAG: LLM class flavin-dependent oxidoreductase [Actinobacteria bacterium]|nr:LLM class flavin-dependent oxidoreductase [Actinomycetota bacterium]
MRFGLSLPHYDFSLPGERISFRRAAELARTAEGLGFDSVWVSDHFFLSLAKYGGGGELHGSLESMTTLAGLAAVTERVRIGTLVACAPFRHPAILAKMATAVDLYSEGRLDLGIGAGWYEDEFHAFAYPFGTVGERFSVLEETMEALSLMFAEGPATFEGRHFRLSDAYNHPRPVQRPRPPIWLGAKGGERSLRLAARHADGWNTAWRWSPDGYAERVRAARRICEEEGRDPATLRLSVGLYTLVGEDEGDLVRRFRAMQRWTPGGALDGELLDAYMVDTLTGTPEQALERVRRFAKLGVEEIIVCPASLPFAVPDPSMLEILAEAVMEPARAQ